MGNWKLSIKGGSGVGFSVSVAGNNEIGFEIFNFVEYKEYRAGLKSFFPIQGQPAAGTEQTAVANLIGAYDSAAFILVSETGTELKAINLYQGHEDATKKDFVGNFELPAERFRVAVKGTDKNGSEFLRVFPTAYLGQTVKVKVGKSDSDMFVGKPFTAHFNITNLDSKDTFQITAADSHGLVSSVTPKTLAIETNETKDVEVVLNIPADFPSGTVTLTVVAKSTTNTNVENSSLLTRTVSADSDRDGDGTSDSSDGCPNDPNKTEPGLCGCGIDNCPNDPNKTEPSACGCGVADTDTDNDGTPDCPNDRNKTEPGVCGCGNPENLNDDDSTCFISSAGYGF